jgi:hypothetical protein
MMDDDSLQDSQRGVPGNIRIPREDATVGTAALVASQGSVAVFQQRAHCTLLEIEQDEVVVRKGNCGLLGQCAGKLAGHRLLDWSFYAFILVFPVIWYFIFGSWFKFQLGSLVSAAKGSYLDIF